MNKKLTKISMGRWNRWNKKQRSFIIFVLLPTMICMLYHLFISADIYVVETKFSVKGNQSSQLDVLGGLTGITSNSPNSSDSYILQEYLHSLEIISELKNEIDLEAIFNNKNADIISRLGNEKSQEDFLLYWQKKVFSSYDPTTNVTVLKVRTFSPKDSLKLANMILKYNEILINKLSARARKDDLKFAQEELDIAENRLKRIRLKMTEFRNVHQEFDPTQTAVAKLNVIAELQAKLAMAETELTRYSSFMDKSAPSVVSIKTQIESLEKQIHSEKLTVASVNNDSSKLSSLFADYEPLLVERAFAETAYQSAIASLEAARVESLKKHSYLAVFVEPREPEIPIEPERLKEVATVFLISFLFWSIALLGIGSVRDHFGWV